MSFTQKMSDVSVATRTCLRTPSTCLWYVGLGLSSLWSAYRVDRLLWAGANLSRRFYGGVHFTNPNFTLLRE